MPSNSLGATARRRLKDRTSRPGKGGQGGQDLTSRRGLKTVDEHPRHQTWSSGSEIAGSGWKMMPKEWP